MPLLDISDPKVITFLIENYTKENRLRLNWIIRHKEKIDHAATLHREAKGYYETDVIAHTMKQGMPAITRDFIASGFNRRKVHVTDDGHVPCLADLRRGHSIVDVGLGDPKDDPRLARPDADLTPDPIMRPVAPSMTEIIYKPKPEFGNFQYMAKRGKILPEQRYYFPECSNWDYGWRMADSNLRSRPQFGRCWVLTRTLQSRVGPQPDPDYYKASDPPAVTKIC